MPKNKSTEIIKAVPAEDGEIIPRSIDGVDHNNQFIPIETIIEYANKNLSLKEIARLCGCSAQNIHQRLKAVGFNKACLEHFKSRRGDVFAFIHAKLQNSLDDDSIKKMQPYQRIISAGVLYDKERLERGQSTEIIDITSTINSIEELAAREKILEAQFRELTEKKLNASKEIKTDTNK